MVTQPAPQITSARVLPVMCGTFQRSRTIFTPGRGTTSRRTGPWPRVPNTSGLKYLIRSEFRTEPKSGVSPSYMTAWSSASGGGGTFPY